MLDSEKEAADECEGNGLGADRNINKVDEDPEVRSGTIAAGCPVGDYNLKVSITTPGNLGLALIVSLSIEEPPVVAHARATSKEFNLHTDNRDPSGIWSNGTTIWVADTADDKLYAYALDGGARQTSKEFNLHTDNDTPWGIWSDGTTIWVSDSSGAKLYAYALNGGARQTTQEFDLHSGNDRPTGIWSNGTTIWVTDYTDNKLYAYALDGGARQTSQEFNLHCDNVHPRGIWSQGLFIF